MPAGTVIFTDFDLLSDFELDGACSIATAVGQAGAPNVVLNDPRFAMERFDLLAHLYSIGKNSVEVTRLKSSERPTRYPVFIRFEDGCMRPDFEMIQNEGELDAAVSQLVASGRTLRGRMTASFESAPDVDGNYRKYGAFRVGDHIVAQHILRNPDWIVKSGTAKVDDASIAEELAYVRDNPHEQDLMAIFEAANISFGRMDYTLRDGQIVVFEINMNPTFPPFKGGRPNRQARRVIILERLMAAFHSIDAKGAGGWIPFDTRVTAKRYLTLRREDFVSRLLRLWHRSKAKR